MSEILGFIKFPADVDIAVAHQELAQLIAAYDGSVPFPDFVRQYATTHTLSYDYSDVVEQILPDNDPRGHATPAHSGICNVIECPKEVIGKCAACQATLCASHAEYPGWQDDVIYCLECYERWKQSLQDGKVGEAGAVTAFMGWLTAGEATSGPFSSRHLASPAIELIKQFCESQGWQITDENWHFHLKPYPADSVANSTEDAQPTEQPTMLEEVQRISDGITAIANSVGEFVTPNALRTISPCTAVHLVNADGSPHATNAIPPTAPDMVYRPMLTNGAHPFQHAPKPTHLLHRDADMDVKVTYPTMTIPLTPDALRAMIREEVQAALQEVEDDPIPNIVRLDQTRSVEIVFEHEGVQYKGVAYAVEDVR